MRSTASISALLSSEGSTLVELSKLVLDPVETKAYIDRFKDVVDKTSVHSYGYVKLFHRSSKGYDVKIKTFGTEASTSLVNERSTHQTLTVGKDHVVIEKLVATPIRQVPQTADHLEIVNRTSFMARDEDWLLHIDLVKTLANPDEFAVKLGKAKRDLVDAPLEKMESSAYDFVRTTLVHLKPEAPTISQARDIVEKFVDLSSGDNDTQRYQSEIFALAGDIFRDPMIISQFKHQSGFKRLCANTVELSRPIYFKKVLPVIDTFYVTDKMDGIRAMLVINEVYRNDLYLGAEIKAIADRVYPLLEAKYTGQSIRVERTVLDVEMMTDAKGAHSFHCFDVIMIKSKRMSNSPFKDRFRKFDAANKLLKKHDLGTVKEFIHLTKDNFASQIKAFYEKKRTYHIDGLIFTPEGMYFKNAIKDRKGYQQVFNTDYASTISFKWKPLDQMTIDFYLMAHPTKKGSYMLCSGIDKRTFDLLEMSFFDGYEAPKSPNAHSYFPIQFTASDGSFNPVWTPTAEELNGAKSLAGLVGEFTFANPDNTLLSRPKLMRLRLDRIHDVALGQYYGNALRYAELIWHSIQHPLTLEILCTEANTGYFAADDSDDWYKAQRSFNSFAKTYILETYLYSKVSGKSRLMDIAAGRGQDLARAIDIGYDEIVALDRDVDALHEMLDRKYNLRVKRKGANANIQIKQVDLEDLAETTIAKLKIAGDSADSVMINFALHYICHSAYPSHGDPLVEFAKLCSHYLKTKGRVMITAFDGAEIFNLFANKAPIGKVAMVDGVQTWSVKENDRLKYSIKRMYASKELMRTDQAIEVLLPFSAGEYYREFLVNYDHVRDVFEAQGFKLVTADSFGSLLSIYKKQNSRGYASLSEADREYVSLYGYLVFEKSAPSQTK